MKSQQREYFDQQQLLVNPGPAWEPGRTARQLGCYATLILPFLSTAGLGALFLWQGWEFVLWPFLAIPLGLWVALLGLPLFLKFRHGAMLAVDSLLATFEAYISRAGLAVDLNQDGRVGHYSPEIKPIQVEEYRPILLNAHASTVHKSQPARPMPDSVMRVIGENEAVTDQITRTVWHLPNGQKCGVGELENFVSQIFIRGWQRDTWVGTGPGKFSREVYDGLCLQLEQGGILEGRGKGTTGRLTIDGPDQALAILGLNGGR